MAHQSNHFVLRSGRYARRAPRQGACLSVPLVSCPANNLLDPPADFSVGQGAPTSHSGHYGEEAQRCPTLKGAAQRARYLWDTTLMSTLDHSRIVQVFPDMHADGTREDVFAPVERVRQLFGQGSL